jgi:hypothetical protein
MRICARLAWRARLALSGYSYPGLNDYGGGAIKWKSFRKAGCAEAPTVGSAVRGLGGFALDVSPAAAEVPAGDPKFGCRTSFAILAADSWELLTAEWPAATAADFLALAGSAL